MPFTLQTNPMGVQVVVRAADGALIPRDPSNKDYRDYLAWVAAGSPATWTSL